MLLLDKTTDNNENNNDPPIAEILNDNAINDSVVRDGPLEDSDIAISEDQFNKNTEKDKDNFTYKINSNIKFKNSTSPGEFKIENPSTNKHSLKVEVKTKDAETLVYVSPLLKPNQHITSDVLKEHLSKGKYDAIATIYVVDTETEDVITSIDQDIILKINNNK
jgi:hypothetical protein